MVTMKIKCFRPLTGILFFNSALLAVKRRRKRLRFPSPYGDFVFQPSLRKALSFLT